MTDLWLFTLATLAVLGAPGPTNTLLATGGAMAGVWRSLRLLAAALAGYVVAIGLVRALLGPVLAAAPGIAVALKVAVAIYLTWVAIGVWRSALVADKGRTVTAIQVFVATLLNPKALIFALAIFPAEPLLPLAHSTAFTASAIGCGAGWIVLGHLLGSATGERGVRVIPRIAAVALGGFAGLILYSAFG